MHLLSQLAIAHTSEPPRLILIWGNCLLPQECTILSELLVTSGCQPAPTVTLVRLLIGTPDIESAPIFPSDLWVNGKSSGQPGLWREFRTARATEKTQSQTSPPRLHTKRIKTCTGTLFKMGFARHCLPQITSRTYCTSLAWYYGSLLLLGQPAAPSDTFVSRKGAFRHAKAC